MGKVLKSIQQDKAKMFWVYILKCSDGSYYTGHTDNFEIRIAQHNAGECLGYTATLLPVELAWSQEFNTREEALSAERQIKGWSRKKKEAMMRDDWAEVPVWPKVNPLMVRQAHHERICLGQR
jgi:putative endonuclease